MVLTRKLKIIISSVILAIAILLIGMNTLFNTTGNGMEYYDIDFERDPESEYFMDFEKTCESLTIKQKLIIIQDCEESLENSKARLDSDSLNPEEQFNIICSRRFVKRKLEIVKKSLPKEMQ